MFNCKYASGNIPRGAFLLPLTLLLIVLLLPLLRNLIQPSSKLYASSNLETKETRKCNIFSGNWVPYRKEPYYNNETCPFILDQINCIKSGRPDREFLKLRWKPRDCELPLFDATQFLNLVRGKSMAFVGDSMGRNQLESLLCLINTVARPEDITAKYTSNDDIFFRWWFVADYNFTVTTLWSPFLVKYNDSDASGRAFYSATKLYLDEADRAWSSKIENFDYVIFSTGQWFFRPLTFYENGQVVGCQKCENATELDYYGYRKAFRTAFRAIRNIEGFKGLAFLVTHSPEHFENGAWNEGGTCNRTKPFTKEERGVYKNGDIVEALYQIQVEEFSAAEKEAREKRLRFGLIDITDAMAMRADAHPSRFRRAGDTNLKVNDCVHWCLPGPMDTWNEFLLFVMKLEGERQKGNML
ncbi:trichome birefringence 19 [Spatholobus suberectus]|nr:trichome birefringence 19 [Spatholobus suberectus]